MIGIQEIIVFAFVLLSVVWVVYRMFKKRKDGRCCDSCTADCQLRNLKKRAQQRDCCGNKEKLKKSLTE
jgi:hypothetical protein